MRNETNTRLKLASRTAQGFEIDIANFIND
jgi:hypothetical protein